MNTIAPFLTEAENALLDNDVTRAARLYQLAYEADQGRSPLPAVGVARVAILVGKHQEAALILNRVLARHPASAEALTFRGVAEEALGRPGGALEWHRKAIAADARFGVAHANFGRICGQLGQWKEALAAFRTALSLNPGQGDLVPLIGLAAFRAGAPGEALKALTDHLDREPDHLDTIITLADVLAGLGEVDLAFNLLDQASQRITSSPTLFARLAALAIRRGELTVARQAVARQLELLPSDEEAWLLAASLELVKLDLDEAERMVQRVLELNPRSWKAHYQLGMIYDSLKLWDAAKVAYRNAARCGADAWQPRNNLATLLLEDGTPAAAADARALLHEALALGSREETLEVRYNLALACWQLGDTAASEAACREVVTSGARVPVVEEARRFMQNFTSPSRA